MVAHSSSQKRIVNHRKHKIQVKTWTPRKLQRRARTNHRDWSGWNSSNWNGVPFGDGKDSGYPLITHGHPWISMAIHGYPWISMDYPWISMDSPWMSMDYLWISWNHFRHQMAHHSSWEDFNQTNLDVFSNASLQISRLSGACFSCMKFRRLELYFGKNLGPLKKRLGVTGASKDIFGGILSLGDFSRNPENRDIYV